MTEETTLSTSVRIFAIFQINQWKRKLLARTRKQALPAEHLIRIPQLRNELRKSHILASVFAPFARATGYWNPVLLTTIPRFHAHVFSPSSAVSSYLPWTLKASVTPKLSAALSHRLLRVPQSLGMLFNLRGCHPSPTYNLPSDFSLSHTSSRFSTLNICLLQNCISFDRRHGSFTI